jgi:hypothetical protein
LASSLLSRRASLGIVLGVSLISLVAICLFPRVPLGPTYHVFSDTSAVLSIPNGLNVLSNIPFFLVGICGIVFVLRGHNAKSFLDNRERIPFFVFFTGVMLTGAGSAYYHAAPGDFRLIWDLLPMTLAFVSLTDATIIERISVRTGLLLLAPLLLAGVASVLYWYREESLGNGDLRFYLFIQFFSPIVIALMVCLFSPRYTRTNDLFIAFLLFVLAKLCELFDKQIYNLGGILSGHTLKHLLAGLSSFWLLRMLWRRSAAETADATGKLEGQ